jgi:putative redox protein
LQRGKYRTLDEKQHMVTIDIQYQGELHCEAVHQPSGMRLSTDAPKDNMGKGESFSPTDLVATALGTCMMTLMGIAARSLKVDLTGTQITVQKEMVATPMRRIGKLGVKIAVPARLTAEQKQKLEQAALTCPVHKSLHPDVQLPVEFVWA